MFCCGHIENDSEIHLKTNFSENNSDLLSDETYSNKNNNIKSDQNRINNHNNNNSNSNNFYVNSINYKRHIYLKHSSEILTRHHLRTLIRSTPQRHHIELWTNIYRLSRDGASFNQFLNCQKFHPAFIIIIKSINGECCGCFVSHRFLSKYELFHSSMYHNPYGSPECYVWKLNSKIKHQKKRSSQSSNNNSNQDTKLDSDEKIQIDSHDQQQIEKTYVRDNSVRLQRTFSHAQSSKFQQYIDAYIHPTLSTISIWHAVHPNKNDHYQTTSDKFIAVGGGDNFALFIDDQLKYAQTGKCSTFNNSPLTVEQRFGIAEIEIFAPATITQSRLLLSASASVSQFEPEKASDVYEQLSYVDNTADTVTELKKEN